MQTILKNVAGQKLWVFAFNRTTNAPVTGDTLNIECSISKDYGVFTDTNDLNPTEDSNGYYAFDLSQAETLCQSLRALPVSVTPNVQVIVVGGGVETKAPSYREGKVWVSATLGAGSNGTAYGYDGTDDNPSNNVRNAFAISKDPRLGNSISFQKAAQTGDGAGLLYIASVLDTFDEAVEIFLNGIYITSASNLGFQANRAASITGPGELTASQKITFSLSSYLQYVKITTNGAALREESQIDYCLFGENCGTIDILGDQSGNNPSIVFKWCIFSANPTIFDFDDGVNPAASDAVVRLDWCDGNIEVQNMSGTQRLIHGGWVGKVTINANCTGGTIEHSSHVEITDNSGGAVITQPIQSPATVSSFSDETAETGAKWLMDRIFAAAAGKHLDDGQDQALEQFAGPDGVTEKLRATIDTAVNRRTGIDYNP